MSMEILEYPVIQKLNSATDFQVKNTKYVISASDKLKK